MDLVEIMTKGADPEDLVLDRLQSIVSLYDSLDEPVQDEALARAISLCGKQWGSYRAGMEALAQRMDSPHNQDCDPLMGAMQALRLREEAEDPGLLIRIARTRRLEASRHDAARSVLIARYGSLEAAQAPTPVEHLFIEATRDLAEADHDGIADPWSPLAGWLLPWHPMPEALKEAVGRALPLPETITDARDEALSWEIRLNELDQLSDGPGTPALPTACAARHILVLDLWRRDLPIRSAAEFEARLDFWAGRGGDDGTGYQILLADLKELAVSGSFRPTSESTRDKAHRLKAHHPDWSLARIGQELGISRQAVHKHLKT